MTAIKRVPGGRHARRLPPPPLQFVNSTVSSRPTDAFRRYQVLLGDRIKAIEMRDRPPEPGDDILLSVITDGRPAAIDLRLVDPDTDNEPKNKLNNLIAATPSGKRPRKTPMCGRTASRSSFKAPRR
ncbi:hypothetical protein ABIA00_003222 [Bradyrhizobium ottawaense]